MRTKQYSNKNSTTTKETRQYNNKNNLDNAHDLNAKVNYQHTDDSTLLLTSICIRKNAF